MNFSYDFMGFMNTYLRHLYNNESQKLIIDLNVALLKGNWDDAEKNLNKIDKLKNF